MPSQSDPQGLLKSIERPLRLTYAGMVAEALTRAFWPVWTLLFSVAAFLMLGLQDVFPVELVWALMGAVVLGFVWLVYKAVRNLRWPSKQDATERLDQSLNSRPIQAVLDTQAIGDTDESSVALWHAHQARMRRRLADAEAVEPDLRISKADPYALRYLAVLFLAVALLFGSFGRVQSVSNMGLSGPDLAQGPAWEGWVEPPAYTSLPAIYLNDVTDQLFNVPKDSQITLRMYGEVGALSVTETVSGRSVTEEESQATAQEFAVLRSGELAINGPNGRAWFIATIPNHAPLVDREGEITSNFEGQSEIAFRAQDDHGVVSGVARMELALEEVDRRYGRSIAPEPRPILEVQMPMPIAGSRTDFTETIIDNFSLHPWANLPVRLELEVQDAAGQIGRTESEVITLPGRRFFDPLAAALIEQRQSLLWNRANAKDIALILRTLAHRSDTLFRSELNAMKLRQTLKRIETFARFDMPDDKQEELAQILWDLAIEIEDGDLENARERLRRAQERLEEAMKNGASEDEIAELMQELREATEDYMRQLAREQAREQNQNQQQSDGQENMEMSQSDLQRMMDRIQELMEQGRMEEAMEALRQLQEMMENMQVTEGQQGQSSGEQAMEGLGETLRDQQELSDDAFRDLQEQFNQGQQGQQGQQQQQQPGQQGQQQQGQQGQQFGQGQEQGQGQQEGEQGGNQAGREGQSLEENLAQRQRSLRNELSQQRQNLPGQGTEAGDDAAEALGRAEGAMDDAEQALREGDLAEAIDNQSEAMEALRDAMRDLGEAMAQQQQQGEGQQGSAEAGDPSQRQDPLGRNAGTDGQLGTDEELLQGEDVYRRARELLDEIRRRSGEGERPQAELDYLERLLERF